MENQETFDHFTDTIDLYKKMFRIEPEVIAADMHPEYLATKYARELAGREGLPLVNVQHHHAHIAACLADNGVVGLVIGVALDGTGYGSDGRIWGGEFLVGGYGGFERAGHFLPVAMPGGAKASREPWRNTFAHLRAAFGPAAQERAGEAGLAGKPLDLLDRMIEKGLNAPPASSAGRLFDAVAAAIGLCGDRQSYEAQAAMALEARARSFVERERSVAACSAT